LAGNEVRSGVIFILSPPASVSGTVTDKTTSAPIANSAVIIQNSQQTLTVRTNSSGQFQIIGVNPGQFTVKAAAQDFVPAPTQPVNLSANQVLSGVQFQLEHSGHLTVTVTDA